jgi:hypothetical protein
MFNDRKNTYFSSLTIRDSEDSMSITSVSALLVSLEVKGRLRTTTRILGGSFVLVRRSISLKFLQWFFQSEVVRELFLKISKLL